MRIKRMDLDGKGPIPVPIEELCAQLDISKIAELETEAFEGGLITDTPRSSGIILVNMNRPRQRQRFSIAHELGHFLIPTHMPSADGRFLCSREDMRKLSAKENDRRARMEVEANRFSALILIPPPAFRKDLQALPNANLSHVVRLARRYDVSKEAMSRAYASYHDETLAIVVCKDGRILRTYRDTIRFPFIQPSNGQRVPQDSLYHRADSELDIRRTAKRR